MAPTSAPTSGRGRAPARVRDPGPPPARAIIKPYAGKPKGPRKPRLG